VLALSARRAAVGGAVELAGHAAIARRRAGGRRGDHRARGGRAAATVSPGEAGRYIVTGPAAPGVDGAGRVGRRRRRARGPAAGVVGVNLSGSRSPRSGWSTQRPGCPTGAAARSPGGRTALPVNARR
jgi:hypothetical protein